MTDNGKQYAEALFDLAREDDVAGEIARGLDLVMDAFVRTPEYVQFLDSPAVPRDERTAAVESAFSDLVHPYVVSTVCLMTRKGQIQDFDECVREYRLLYRDSVRHAEARVCSAAPLTDEEKARVRSILEKRSGRSVDISYAVDEKLIGGIMIDIEGERIDGSLRRRLQDLKEVMEQ